MQRWKSVQFWSPTPGWNTPVVLCRWAEQGQVRFSFSCPIIYSDSHLHRSQILHLTQDRKQTPNSHLLTTKRLQCKVEAYASWTTMLELTGTHIQPYCMNQQPIFNTAFIFLPTKERSQEILQLRYSKRIPTVIP
jgi:hypothetical protein